MVHLKTYGIIKARRLNANSAHLNKTSWFYLAPSICLAFFSSVFDAAKLPINALSTSIWLKFVILIQKTMKISLLIKQMHFRVLSILKCIGNMAPIPKRIGVMVAWRSPKPFVKVRILDPLPRFEKARCISAGFFMSINMHLTLRFSGHKDLVFFSIS